MKNVYGLKKSRTFGIFKEHLYKNRICNLIRKFKKCF